MKKNLRVLIIEDSEEDALLLVRHFERNSYHIDFQHVDNAQAFQESLEKENWDCVLSDFELPRFSVKEALDIFHANGKDIPFIVISGVFDEKIVVDVFHMGVSDFIRKDRLSRLIPALEREIRDAGIRREKLIADEKIKHLVSILSAIRNVNQLIIRENNPRKLIQSVCKSLTATRGYPSSLIVLTNGPNAIKTSAHSNWNSKINLFIDEMQSGRLCFCTKRAIEKKSAIVIPGSETECINCELHKDEGERTVLTAPLLHCERHFGFINVSLPDYIPASKEEVSLFQEVTSDISYALYNIEMEDARIKADKSLKSSEEFNRRVIESSNDCIKILDLNGNLSFMSPSGQDLMEIDDLSSVLNESWIDFWEKDDREAAISAINEAKKGETGRFQGFCPTVKGTPKWWDVSVTPIRDAKGAVESLLSVSRDITDHRRTEAELKRSEMIYRDLVDKAGVAITVDDADGYLKFYNRRFAELFGYDMEELKDQPIRSVVHPDDIERVMEYTTRRHGRMSAPLKYEFKGVRKDESVIYLEIDVVELQDIGGKTTTRSYIWDITERKTAEDALRSSEAQLSNALKIAQLGPWEYNVEKDVFIFNDAFYAIFRTTAKDVGGYIMSSADYAKRFVHPDDASRVGQEIQFAIESADPNVDRRLEHRIIYADGEEGFITVRFFIVKDASGKTVRTYGVNQDITKRKKAEEALRESETKFRNLIEHSNDAIYLLYEGRFEIVNKRFLEIHGCTADEIRKEDFNLMDFVAPESRSLIEERARIIKKGIQPPSRYEFSIINKEGVEIEVEASVTQIPFQDGHATLGILRDISVRKNLENQLRQSQKMEGIGKLAGGVAHDFNNILTVISGHTDLLSMSLDSHDPLLDDINQISDATDRATDLTRQLLAFSRKQTLQPKVLNLNSLISNLNKMLKRIIGEDIDLAVHPEENIWKVKVDPGQIDQVIINLSVNARDVMPDGGRLTIETQNVVLDEAYTESHPEAVSGPHVMLAVSDNGAGMNIEVQKHIFEPFFTTKSEGKGTGLGLSTVYGIVKQSGGYISVYSEVGEGTVFRIYFPKVDTAEDSPSFEVGAVELPRGNETIMIVEDEDGVRKFASRVLKQQGYTIIEAENGGEAFMIAKEQLDKPVDLLLTDVIMPNMGGAVLAKNLHEIWPDLKVLYMSGYTANAIAHSGVLDPDKPYLQKPFRPIDLAWKVRRVLDE